MIPSYKQSETNNKRNKNKTLVLGMKTHFR